MAIGRTFARTRRYPVEPRSELLALSLGNAAAGLFQGYPANASFAQTALSDGAGGRTVVASIVTKGALIATLLLLTPLFANLPYPCWPRWSSPPWSGSSTSASGGCCASSAPRSTRPAGREAGCRCIRSSGRRRSRSAARCCSGILNGIVVGVIVTLLAVLYRSARPRIAVLGKSAAPGATAMSVAIRRARTQDDVLIVRFESQLFFASAEYFHHSVVGLVDAHDPPPSIVVLVCDAMTQIDITGTDVLSRPRR